MGMKCERRILKEVIVLQPWDSKFQGLGGSCRSAGDTESAIMVTCQQA